MYKLQELCYQWLPRRQALANDVAPSIPPGMPLPPRAPPVRHDNDFVGDVDDDDDGDGGDNDNMDMPYDLMRTRRRMKLLITVATVFI